jgi:hypothetical protein
MAELAQIELLRPLGRAKAAALDEPGGCTTPTCSGADMRITNYSGGNTSAKVVARPLTSKDVGCCGQGLRQRRRT